jgi:hypothetical protein
VIKKQIVLGVPDQRGDIRTSGVSGMVTPAMVAMV